MPSAEDRKYMQRCLDLALKAEGYTYPNPLVGSVIVHNGRIIGEGYHLRAGGPHAEKIAINSVAEKDLLKSSSLYVNLEPCNHFGRTPPCTDMIIGSGIRRIVAGTTDTSAAINGRGISDLRNSQCEVITGILEKECRWLNRRFFTFHERKRPYIILKWAQSYDGYLDVDRDKIANNRPTWITGKAERILVHRWRAAEQSILVGAGTVRADNPMLNVREWPGNDPLRIILSSSGILDPGSAVFKHDNKSVIFTHNPDLKPDYPPVVIMDRRRSSALQVTEYLWRSGIQSLFIEGGAETISHFISEDLWDEARIFTGNMLFMRGVPAPVIKGKTVSETDFTESHLEVIFNEKDRIVPTD